MASSVLVRVVATAVAASSLALVPSAAQAADPWASDTDGPVQEKRDARGRLTFAAPRAGGSIDNPQVSARTSPRAAAAQHLQRYRAELGVESASDFETGPSQRLASGADVVRLEQQADGLPVLGGEVVMVLDDERSLESVQANVVDVPSVAAARVSEREARRRAVAVVRKQVDGRVSATSARRVVLDPALFDLPAGAASAWEVEVGNGFDVRRHVYVDDRSGGVVRVVDLVPHLDRVVCDAQDQVLDDPTCGGTGVARAEGQPATGDADVDDAYEHAGAVVATYRAAGVDLDAMLSTEPGGDRLAATVRVCVPDDDCPWPNAAWTGTQMIYGSGYASADDVVGHEMTHGFVQRTSNLFYFGEPGAINESMADVVGEIVDQGRGTDDDAAWELGEDLPGGAIRSMSEPASLGQPDTTASPLWHTEASDAEGVHVNSGVGNKTAYLISHGGSLGGQTVTGIDGGDATRTKTLLLYLDTIRSLGSTSDYAALGRVLNATCTSLVGTHGFTAADCAQVAKSVAATGLAQRPAALGEDPAATMTCPDGLQPHVLADLDDFTTTSPAWQQVPRDPSFAVPEPGERAWYGDDYALTDPSGVQGGVAAITAPDVSLWEGERTYLFLEHWYAFESGQLEGQAGTAYFDGGYVAVQGRAGTVSTPVGSRWANGPQHRLAAGTGNPRAGTTAFAGSSKGWTGSRLDLTDLPTDLDGAVDVAVVMAGDATGFEQGWYVRQATVYACQPPVAGSTPTIRGRVQEGEVLEADAGTWGPDGVRLTYQWFRGSTPVAGETDSTYTTTSRDVGARLSVEVTGRLSGHATTTRRSAATDPVMGVLVRYVPSLSSTDTLSYPGTVSVTTRAWGPGTVRLTYQWFRGSVAIPGATARTYRLTAQDLGQRLRARVTGTRTGYLPATTYSPWTPSVRGSMSVSGARITGTLKVGRTVRAVGRWTPARSRLTYQWKRGSSKIKGATRATYRLTSRDRGKKISVVVTATYPRYLTGRTTLKARGTVRR